MTQLPGGLRKLSSTEKFWQPSWNIWNVFIVITILTWVPVSTRSPEGTFNQLASESSSMRELFTLRSTERLESCYAFAFSTFFADGCERRPSPAAWDAPAWPKSVAMSANKAEEVPLWTWWQLEEPRFGGGRWQQRLQHLGKPDVSLVCGISYGVWPWSWWGQLCSVIPDPPWLLPQPLTSKHSLPVDCLGCPNPCNKFIFCSELTRVSLWLNWTLNCDWQYCCPSRALCYL